MEELNTTWESMLEDAIRRAEVSGRTDVAEYLRLKALNDLVRKKATDWLRDAFIEAAMERSRSQPSIKVEREDTFSFARGTGTMDGDRLLITFGVRCLEVRTGWPQRPQSGIMRGNALAAADIVHFGLSRSNQYLSLIAAGPTPRWVSEGGEEFGLESVAAHLSLLTDG